MTDATAAALAEHFGDALKMKEPLGSRTTYRVGGPAQLMIEAQSEEELVLVHQAIVAGAEPLAFMVVGKGSNVLVADEGFPGLVVVLGRAFDHVEVRGCDVVAGAATLLPILARRSSYAGLTGLEWAVGVPGTVGGGVRMNAGGHGSEISATLVSATVFDLFKGTTVELLPADLGFSYRHSYLAPQQIVTGARFKLQAGDIQRSRDQIDEIVRWRREHQPGGSNAGSVFVNPEQMSAGELVDRSGLKGFRLGSAEVSLKHANFIQADDGGRAEDVHRLVAHVHGVVLEKTGVDLATELKMVGFPGDPLPMVDPIRSRL